MGDLTEIIFDFIVVGSGPSGVMCAQTLVESGKKVLMLDAGITNKKGFPDFLEGKNFNQIRESEPLQSDIFLGKNFDGIGWHSTEVGSQLTPSRKFVTEKVKEFLPVRSNNFFPFQTLAYGGLGEAWGLGCYMFSKNEQVKAGLNAEKMQAAYQVIANRIGISYSKDDIDQYSVPGIEQLQTAIKVDDNAKLILKYYEAQRNKLRKSNFSLGIPALALLTADKNGRSKTDYTNMDFYNNVGLSAYRSSITIDELKRISTFNYLGDIIVLNFTEEEGIVKIVTSSIKGNERLTFSAKKLIMATGVIGTARIVLRSFEKLDTKIPFLCNPYSYFSCVQWKMLGKIPGAEKTSTVQLSLFHDKDNQNTDVAMASIYSYSSLMLFRAMKEVPLSFKDALVLMQYLLPATVIAGIHQPDESTERKYLRLLRDKSTLTGDLLEANYELNTEEERTIRQRENLFSGALRKLGCFPVKKINPGHGASVHYAGAFPFHSEEKLLTTQYDGRLSCTQNVYIADASGFKYLPAKGVTFTLMANAHLVALNALQNV